MTVRACLDSHHDVVGPLAGARSEYRGFEVKLRVTFPPGKLGRALGQRGECTPNLRKKISGQEQVANDVSGRRLSGVLTTAAVFLGDELHVGAQELERTVGEVTAVLEPLLVHPVDRFLRPLQTYRSKFTTREVAHGAIGLRELLDLVFWQLRRLVETGGIAHHRPDLRHWPVELPHPGPALRCSHTLLSSLRSPPSYA